MLTQLFVSQTIYVCTIDVSCNIGIITTHALIIRRNNNTTSPIISYDTIGTYTFNLHRYC
jgi:hypothetical protein